MRRSKSMINTQRLGICEKGWQNILSFDLYKRPFAFLMPDHTERYRTFVGAMLSILTLIIVVAYGAYKITDLL